MNAPSPEDQEDLPEDIVRRLELCAVRYFVTGSQASGLYAEPRFTQEFDVVIESSADALQAFSGIAKAKFSIIPRCTL